MAKQGAELSIATIHPNLNLIFILMKGISCLKDLTTLVKYSKNHPI
jgi:hypothetical protein